MARVLVPLAPGCEEIEAVTIIDILRRAGIEVVAAGLSPGPLKASRGVNLVPDTTLDAVLDQDFDLVALPGGKAGMEALKAEPRIKALLQRMAASGKYTTAICAAPAVLAEAGLLAGKRVTREGILVIEASRHRTRERNRRDARERLSEWLRKAARPPIPRKETRPTRESKARRLAEKVRHGAIKRARKAVLPSDS